jgi:hypothetical protein
LLILPELLVSAAAYRRDPVHAAAERCRKVSAGRLSAGPTALVGAEAERFRNDCLRTCAKPIEFGDQNPYSLKRHASNRVKPYLLFPWAAELVRHSRISVVWRDH